jgi:putative phosphoribosyl transferase
VRFLDRKEAGIFLAKKLKKYTKENTIVFAIPRGGVVVAFEISKKLGAPLNLIITRKIGHPNNPEYAFSAISESGYVIDREKQTDPINTAWLTREIEKEKEEASRRRKKYFPHVYKSPVTDKVAILVDDGVATGYSIRAGIAELRMKNPRKIIVAVPVVPLSTEKIIKKEADEIVALERPSDFNFLGSVGAYYESFPQVGDEEVVDILKQYRNEQK